MEEQFVGISSTSDESNCPGYAGDSEERSGKGSKVQVPEVGNIKSNQRYQSDHDAHDVIGSNNDDDAGCSDHKNATTCNSNKNNNKNIIENRDGVNFHEGNDDDHDHDHDLDHDDDHDEDEDDDLEDDMEEYDEKDDADVEFTRKQVRKLRRVMANRRSARESRERRKKLLAELQLSVDKLTAENNELAKNNVAMQQELLLLLQQSGLVVPIPAT